MLKYILIYFLMSSAFTSVFYANDVKSESNLDSAVDNFIIDMTQKHGFTVDELKPWFAEAKVNQKILKSISRPAEAALPWHRYRNIFIQQERVDLGIDFWNKHAETLQRAETKFGVPAELIVGLIGVETKYGRIKGKFDVFNALYTLGFHFPRRSKFFLNELKEFLLLAKEQQWTVGSTLGSYAGAMGYGQFMPSSYRMYAVDFDHDGNIDLLDNPVDAIGSVANYIKVHGWITNESIVSKAIVSGDSYKKYLQKRLKPKYTITELQTAGVIVEQDFNSEDKVVLIELQQKDHKEFWVGKYNFYVISRYNPRLLYTMAVVQLTELIKDQYQKINAAESK